MPIKPERDLLLHCKYIAAAVSPTAFSLMSAPLECGEVVSPRYPKKRVGVKWMDCAVHAIGEALMLWGLEAGCRIETSVEVGLVI